MKHVLFISLIAGCLAGCAGMQGLDTEPRASMTGPADVGATGESTDEWPPVRWWERYQDPNLNNLLDRALEQSPDLRLAQARMEQAAAMAEQVGAQSWPKINANASTARKRYAQEYDAGPPLAGNYGSAFTLGVEAQYTFDFWGGQRAALRAALGEASARNVEIQAARLMLTSRIVRAWFELAHSISTLELAKEALALRSQTLRVVDRRVPGGPGTEGQYQQAQGDLPATEGDILRLTEQIALQRNALSALAGLPIDALSEAKPRTTSVAQSPLPASVPAALIGHRPDLVAARWRVEAATQDVEGARTEFYPNISLRAFAGFARQSLSVGLSDWLNAGSRTYVIEPAITLPIFDAGRLRARYKGRAAELDAAIETYNQTLLSAVRDVADQLVSLEALAPQSSAQARTLSARQTAFDLAQKQYQAGLTDYLTVLNAQNVLLRERERKLDLQTRALILDAELNRALGGGFDAADTTINLARKQR